MIRSKVDAGGMDETQKDLIIRGGLKYIQDDRMTHHQ